LKLPVAACPSCRRAVIVYQTVAAGADPGTAPLETRCIDCDARLDRFGVEPGVVETPLGTLTGEGYTDLDRPPPIGQGGCFEDRGCDGCPKIETRPW